MRTWLRASIGPILATIAGCHATASKEERRARPDSGGIAPDEFKLYDGVAFERVELVGNESRVPVAVTKIPMKSCGLLEIHGVPTLGIAASAEGPDPNDDFDDDYVGVLVTTDNLPPAGYVQDFTSGEGRYSVSVGLHVPDVRYFSNHAGVGGATHGCRLALNRVEPLAERFALEGTLRCDALPELKPSGAALSFEARIACENGVIVQYSRFVQTSATDPATGRDWRLVAIDTWSEARASCASLGEGYGLPSRELLVASAAFLRGSPMHGAIRAEGFEGDRRLWSSSENTTVSLDTISPSDPGGLHLQPWQKSHVVCVK